jgi:hypothetical protein
MAAPSNGVSLRLSTASRSFFSNERVGDVLMTGALQTQRILLGSSGSNGDAILALDSNRTTVGGDLIAHRAAASLVQSTELLLGPPDSNLHGVVSFPPFHGWVGDGSGSGSHPSTSNQAFRLGQLATDPTTGAVQSLTLSAAGLLITGSNTVFQSNARVMGELRVEGVLTAGDVRYSNVTVYESQDTRSNLDVLSRLLVAGPLVSSNTLTSSSNAWVGGTLVVNNYGESNTSNVTLHVNGSISATNDITAFGRVLDLSDSNLKSDLAPIEGALARVRALNGYTFAMRGDPGGRRRMGLLAQEVLPVAPEAVQEQPGGSLTVAYGNLVGLLVEAVKELADVVGV